MFRADIDHSYNMDDLYLVIDKLIKDKTGKPPKRASAKTSSATLRLGTPAQPSRAIVKTSLFPHAQALTISASTF